MNYRKSFLFVCTFFFFGVCHSFAAVTPEEGVSYTVVVIDSSQNSPLQLARVVLRRHAVFVAGKVTNPAGRAVFSDITPGWYTLDVRLVDYSEYRDSILIDKDHEAGTVNLHPIIHEEVTVTGEHEQNITTVDLKSGAQIFESETYHPSPSAGMTQLLQENMTGAARAPTGEVHIKGQHGEFTYYVDGVPVPLGVFGGLNDIIDQKVIDRATFITGGQPAEYGGQVAAVVDVQTHVPSGKAHLDVSGYSGSYLGAGNSDTLGLNAPKLKPININGYSLSYSDHVGNLGIFVSGSRQETDRRIDPPLPYIYHNHGFDYFGYAKLDYLLGDNDYITSNLNFGKTLTQIPFDPRNGTGVQDDNQATTNSFQTLSYFHTISKEAEKESNFFLGLYAREGGLIYTPGQIDAPSFIFGNDTTHPFNLAEDRNFTTLGLRTKYDIRFSHELMFAAGLNLSSTSGTESFTSFDSAGKSGPSPNVPFKGSDFGIFAQTEYHPAEWTRIDLGIRYDQHIAPDVPLQKQVSPRLKWNIFFDENTTGYLYYGKLFMPNNIEGLRLIASNVPGNTPVPTLPERDDFYEAAILHNFDFGLRGKFDYFQKVDLPGVDDQTVGSSAIKTPVNIAEVRIQGIELGLSFSNPMTPFSGYANFALTHAYGIGAVTGGFLAYSSDGSGTDLDHDQRLSVVIGLKYQPENWFITLTPIYGSGLTNGNPEGLEYKTGLFDFNQAQHTTPSWIVDISSGYRFQLAGGAYIEPSLFINNITNNIHLIKGSYFSAASWEEPRNVVLKVNVHI